MGQKGWDEGWREGGASDDGKPRMGGYWCLKEGASRRNRKKSGVGREGCLSCLPLTLLSGIDDPRPPASEDATEIQSGLHGVVARRPNFP